MNNIQYTPLLNLIISFFNPVLSQEIPVDKNNNYDLKIYWNVPSFQCRSHGVFFNDLNEKYGIIQNINDDFLGDKISILYDPGNFPALLRNSTNNQLIRRNGGVPQEGNLFLHLDIFKTHLDRLIPDENFNGIGVIDFESWRPIFRQNFGTLLPYKNLSIEIEKINNPGWPESKIKIEAQRRFEDAGKQFMDETLLEVKSLRPKAKWGYYAYPYCFNMYRKDVPECPAPVPEENDRTLWLFQSSDVLFPSLYLRESDLNSFERQQLIYGRINEAKRIKFKTGNKSQIMSYFWYLYQDTREFLTKDDMYKSLELLKNLNIDGVIMWGSSLDVKTRQKCQRLRNYVDNILGPIIKQLKAHVQRV